MASVGDPALLMRVLDATRAELDAFSAVHDACGSGAPACAAVVRVWRALAALVGALDEGEAAEHAPGIAARERSMSDGLPPPILGELPPAFKAQVLGGSASAPGEPFDAPSDRELRRHRRRLLRLFAELERRARRLAPSRRRARIRAAAPIVGGVVAIASVLVVLQRPRWRVSYYANSMLEGPPAFVAQLHAAEREWGLSGPGNGVPSDFFSARFEACLHLPQGGRVRFDVGSDDGARLFVDGATLIDAWVDQGFAKHDAVLALTAGVHKLRLDYYERTGAARVSFAAHDEATGADLAARIGLPSGQDAACPAR